MSMEELDQDLMKAGQDAEEKEHLYKDALKRRRCTSRPWSSPLCRLRTFHGVADHEALGKEWLGLR